jgi:chromate transporter
MEKNYIAPSGEIVSFREAAKVWLKVALMSFGGPAGQIAVMHKLVVEEKKWVEEKKFLNALNFCMLLPGPEAQQLATYLGAMLHKTRGGLMAGGLFILPGFVSILVLSILYVSFYQLDIVQAIFFGIKPAILAIVVGAILKIGKRSLKTRFLVLMAILAFVAIFFLVIPFPIVILGAALIGVARESFYPQFPAIEGPGEEIKLPRFFSTFKIILGGGILWFFPVVLFMLLYGKDSIFVTEALFFSKAALVTFGGAYSVLTYIAQRAVEDFNWLVPGQMIDGLGMAETTPGPLIQVVQFVGFMGAYNHPGEVDPMTAAILASLLVTWVTFVPCFIFIFAGAPYVEYLMANKYLKSAFNTLTAAVVGAILNLGVWFTLNVIFKIIEESRWFGIRYYIPEWETFNFQSFIIAIASFIFMFLLKLDMLKTLGLSVILGILLWFVF